MSSKKTEDTKAPVEEAAVEEAPAYIIEWKGETIDLRGFNGFRFWQTENRTNPAVRDLHAHLVADGKCSTDRVPCDSVSECQDFQRLTGPYFGNTHG